MKTIVVYISYFTNSSSFSVLFLCGIFFFTEDIRFNLNEDLEGTNNEQVDISQNLNKKNEARYKGSLNHFSSDRDKNRIVIMNFVEHFESGGTMQNFKVIILNEAASMIINFFVN